MNPDSPGPPAPAGRAVGAVRPEAPPVGILEPKPGLTRGPAPARGQLVVVANRLPVRRVKRDGSERWEPSPGGLVSALKPVLREQGGAWIGWPGGSATPPDDLTDEGIRLRAVTLSGRAVEGYYGGFSNSTIWPLYHDAIRVPEFHKEWWDSYASVNRRFADAAVESAGERDTVWIHDYHLQLVPAMVREARPSARIGFFLHIPFPPVELLARLPWRREVVEGLLGADLIGFQTENDAQNFVDAAKRFTVARPSRAGLFVNGRNVSVGAFPISIDVAQFERLAASPRTAARAADLRRRLVPERKVFLGVDRLDYTKGIDVRLRAFEEALRRKHLTTAGCVLVQVAVPSRENVAEYVEMRERIEGLVGRINGEFGEPGRVAVHYLRRNLPVEELAAYYKLADVMVVTPLKDGMNLVAKEYVASRTDDTGALVLSEFTGAAAELKQAVIVNPYDVAGVASAFELAASMPDDSARRRMSAMRRTVAAQDVFAWARSFLEALEG